MDPQTLAIATIILGVVTFLYRMILGEWNFLEWWRRRAKSTAAVPAPARGIHHRIAVVTGLTSSGKDTVLSHLRPLALKQDSNIFFPTKIITRDPRPEESPGDESHRALAYRVKRRPSEDLQTKEHEYFAVTEIYGNYFGFLKKQLFEKLTEGSDVTIVFINSAIDELKSLKIKLEQLVNDFTCSRKQQGFNVANFKIDIKIILIDAPVKICLHRLLLRGIPPEARDSRQKDLEDYSQALTQLKKGNFFDNVLVNDNTRDLDHVIQELHQCLLQR